MICNAFEGEVEIMTLDLFNSIPLILSPFNVINYVWHGNVSEIVNKSPSFSQRSSSMSEKFKTDLLKYI